METIQLRHLKPDVNGNRVSIILKNDHYINATRMCKDTNKDIRKFLRHVNVPDDKMQVSNKGTWLHISVAEQLARWISQDYGDKFIEILATKLIEKENRNTEEIVKENERLVHENERLIKENIALQAKAKDAIEQYDKEIGYKQHWQNYSMNYKTAYEYARDRYGIDMTESTYKKVEKEMKKKWNKRNEQSNIQHTLRTAWERYNMDVKPVRPLNPEILRPPFPDPPKSYKIVTPRIMTTYHRRDWDLLDELFEIYKNDPPYDPLGCRDLSMYDFEKGKLVM